MFNYEHLLIQERTPHTVVELAQSAMCIYEPETED